MTGAVATTALTPDRDEFDVCGALPVGTTVLEASAGTGKTYTIAALAARYVAEGHALLSQLLLVTFGRMATNELRLRVRERLVSVERRLATALGGGAIPTGADEVERLLCTGPPAELRLRHRRIGRALSDFDAATIATTHEFCLRMLDELGILGDREPQAVFVEHLSELTREVASDVYLRRYAGSDRPPTLDYEEAQRIAAQSVEAADTRLVPEPTAGEAADAGAAVAEDRVAFATEVRREVCRRKELGRLFTYDDMLTRLRDALAHPTHGPTAARRLRDRYRIVLVDEFQDTDPVQWDILRRAFHRQRTLVLIGDPKQAIYAFRGADVFSYLEAVGEADSIATLGTNRRSDQPLVDAVGALLGGAALGDPRIVVRPVHAHQQGRRLSASLDSVGKERLTAPVRLRVIAHDAAAERTPSVNVLRPQIVSDLVADVTEVLAARLQLEEAGVRREVGPADIAILIRRNERAEVLREALVGAGVPTVVLGATSVYASSTADEWLTLLTALDQPRQARVREAALTSFFGWSFTRLVAADDDEVTELTQQVRWFGRVLRSRGVAALVERITQETRLTERLLAQVGGERRLTDLRHIGQGLHAAMVAGQLGPGALLDWLRERMSEARGSSATEGLRRLETDADAVQILTVHRSKGLEFPIVYLPEAWDRHVNAKDAGWTLRLHDGAGRALDVGGVTGQGRGDRLARWRREEEAEDLRLLYVALTRAQCQVVTWWAPSVNTPASALQRFLYGPRLPAVEPEPRYELAGDPFAAPVPGPGWSLEAVSTRPAVPWHAPPEAAGVLRPREFSRELDLEWRRTSYSALTAAVHGLDLSQATVDSEAEPVKEDDETALLPELVSSGAGVSTATDPALDLPSPMAELPSGAQFGTVVHAVLEAVDLQATDLPAEVRRATADELARSQPGLLTVDGLSAALLPSLQTPLGPLAGDVRLCDISSSDRLPELTFELPLAGGDVSTRRVLLGELAPLLRARLAPNDPLQGYAELVGHPAVAEQSLRGYLTGSIDAVLRVRPDGPPRYLVVDYKTNWLGTFDGAPLTVGDYAPPQLAAAMMQAHYPLQALLYSVAVHRYLRWRQPGYDPEQHLGGVLYLFLRGMAGPDTPTVDGVPCGVFSWRPPAQLVTDLSDLLEGAS